VLADKLLKSLYVDNCVTSVATYEDLRGWECTLEVDNSESGEYELVKVLGLAWNKRTDSLSCEIPPVQVNDDVTKRVILSYYPHTLYVDNCVTSVATYEEYEQFRRQATEIMFDARMDLRGWECTLEVDNSESGEYELVKVLGLVWNKRTDSLSCEIPPVQVNDDVTKRVILSYLSKVFDPIGFLCPALLPLKVLLQDTWLAKVGWDEKLPKEAVNKLIK